ncbi:site-specific integrase [Rhodocyclus tenuis]|uniref:Integrase n=1 Tax=Rhodocyclus tenuis TaxID=1066 RepID=A0A840G6H7_RHOTE|nr:integrase [Rhodocyclus tenuis]MBB4247973.1 integrase [Rhodocyclus tenuis]
MSMPLLDLRPLKGAAPTEKAIRPVSVAIQPDGTPFVVSRFGDDIWDWYPYLPNANLPPSRKRLDWNITLPDGSLLTDAQHAHLLDAAKDFLWSLFAQPIEGRKRPILRSLITKSFPLILLLRWMVTVGIRRFTDLNGLTLDYASAAKRTKSGVASPKTVTARLSILEDMYHQRNKLSDALMAHPWPGEAATSLAGEKQGGIHRRATTAVIPDKTLGQLASAAIDYIRNKAPEILAAAEAVEAAGEKFAASAVSKSWISIHRTEAAREAGYAGTYELIKEVTRLRTACYVLIDMFSGIRDSEMMSLSEGCIWEGSSTDGSVGLMWLHGTIYKTGVRPKRWLVPPIVAEAVRILTRVTASVRRDIEDEKEILAKKLASSSPIQRARLIKRLDIVRNAKFRLFVAKQGGVANVLCGTRMNKLLKEFCEHCGINDGDGRPYSLYAHQFRRTYAHFVARSELGDLLTLRDHFGHWSIDMTTYYADGGADEYEADTELLEMVSKEKVDRQGKIIGGYLDSDTPLANGGHWLKDWRASVRTAANKEELIKEYAGTITLNGTGHSWCVGNARGTGCGGLCVFEAQMCVECNYGIIGQEHRSAWEGIREQQMEALALDDMGPGGRARSKNILNYAEKVLRRLNGQESA